MVPDRTGDYRITVLPCIRITVDNYREKEYTTLIEHRNTVLVRRMKMFLYMIRTEGRR
jgi:hypothetical protein